MATSQARDRLLAAAVAEAVHGGIMGQSLREMAAAIGTSHRMLLYHFKSREGLLVAICNAINESVAGTLGRWDDPRQLWAHFADPALWPGERLFFELYAQALFGRPGTEGFIEASVYRWIDGLARELVEAGVDEATARIQARLDLAVARGLLLDLLGTGDRDDVDQAYELYLQLVSPAGRRSPPAYRTRKGPAAFGDDLLQQCDQSRESARIQPRDLYFQVRLPELGRLSGSSGFDLGRTQGLSGRRGAMTYRNSRFLGMLTVATVMAGSAARLGVREERGRDNGLDSERGLATPSPDEKG